MSDIGESVAETARRRALMDVRDVTELRSTVATLLVERDRLRHQVRTLRHEQGMVLDLCNDATDSGRTTVLIENVRRAMGAY